MQGNSNNKNQKWLNELNNLESLPGEDIDMQSSWNKLHSKRKESPKSKKYSWYWLATACLVLVISLPWFFNNNTSRLAGNVQLMTVTISVEPKSDQAVKMPEATKSIAVVSPKADIKKKIILRNAEKMTVVAAVRPENMPTENTVLLPAPDTFPKSIAATPVKKKLQVVHLNDIENNNNNAYLQQDGKPYFPVKFKSREVLTSNSAARTGLDNLIRIKISPQN